MTPSEMIKALDAIEVAINALTTDPREWGPDDLDDSIAVWDRLDRLVGQLTVLRRDHAVVAARRVDDQYTATSVHGPVTVHRVVETNHTWDGHALLGDLAQPVIDANGEKIDAIPVDIARAVIPACGQGAVSSKWKITELAKVAPEAERKHHTVTFGDAVIARGVRYNARPRSPKPEPAQDTQ